MNFCLNCETELSDVSRCPLCGSERVIVMGRAIDAGPDSERDLPGTGPVIRSLHEERLAGARQ